MFVGHCSVVPLDYWGVDPGLKSPGSHISALYSADEYILYVIYVFAVSLLVPVSLLPLLEAHAVCKHNSYVYMCTLNAVEYQQAVMPVYTAHNSLALPRWSTGQTAHICGSVLTQITSHIDVLQGHSSVYASCALH